MSPDPRPASLPAASSLDAARRRHRDALVIAPARTKDALLAAIYLAVDAPDYAAANYDALADIVGDLGWLPERAVHLIWVQSPALPAAVRRQVESILAAAVRDSTRSKRPLTVETVQA